MFILIDRWRECFVGVTKNTREKNHPCVFVGELFKNRKLVIFLDPNHEIEREVQNAHFWRLDMNEQSITL